MKKPRLTAAFAALALASVLGPCHAQTIYRIVGADGKVTYSDKPPAAATAAQGKVTGAPAPSTAASGTADTTTTTTLAAAGAASSALPFELRQVASKYPVTLYSSSDCPPCAAGRALLSNRGIPFTERTISSAEDLAALQRLTGENTVPVLTIGGQRLRGYTDGQWTQYLDAAGYPTASALPRTYRSPPATPLVDAPKPPAPPSPSEPKAAPKEASPQAPSTDNGPGPDNPAGIRF